MNRNLIINNSIIKTSIVLLFFYLLSCTSDKVRNLYEWHGLTMGTQYQVKIRSDFISNENLFILKSEIHKALAEVNHQMSTFEKESEISRFNRFTGLSPFKTNPEFVRVIKKSIELYKNTGGAFDVTVAPLIDLWGFGTTGYHKKIPSDQEIDYLLKQTGSDKLLILDSLHIVKKIPELTINLSAIAKGHGVDVVADIINSNGYTDYLVEIGGEVVARGLNVKNDVWRIGIDRPQYGSIPGTEIESIIALKNIAVATSGDYRNFFKIADQYYSHTINPKTGRPVTHNLASTTVIAKTCMEADGIATSVMVMGKEKGLAWVENLSGVEALLIIRNKDQSFSEFQTSGFSKYLITR